MKEVFERIEKHLYKRQYQNAKGQWQTTYFISFVDWQHRPRKFPAGDNLDDARDELGRLRTMNKGRYDWDVEKKERERAKIKAMTLTEWLDRYLDLVKDTPSGGTKRAQCAHLKRLLGHLPLGEVNRVRIMEYKSRRLGESLIRHGGPVEGTKIKGATVNREVSCLVHAINLAADQGLCEGAPKVKKEPEVPRERVLTEKEYGAILGVSPNWLRRVVVGANEAPIDQGVLLKLTWDCVMDGLIVVRGGRTKTSMKQRVGISPELKGVLDELRAEFRRTPNTDRRVFTKGGKPIKKSALRAAFDKAVEDAGVGDFVFKDFRHCCRTKWAAAGLPFEIAEIGMGHTLKGISGRYINLTDDQIRAAFDEMFKKRAPLVEDPGETETRTG